MLKAVPLKPTEKITKPGCYTGVSMARYHGDGLFDGVSASSSVLRTLFNKSAAHCWSESAYNPNRIEREETASLVLGRAAHHLLLGEKHFAREYVIRPAELFGKPWQGNRTDCKAWIADQELKGLTVLKGEQVDHIYGMSQSLSRHPLVEAGVLNGLIESTIAYQDEATGVWIKVRPDANPQDSADFADLKTTTDVGDEAIAKTIFGYGYHMQGAMVGMAAREALGIQMESFSNVFVESKPPYCVRVVTITPADLEMGERQVRVALDLFSRCFKAGIWSGPGGTQTDATFISMPPWSKQRIEDQIANLEREIAALETAE